MTWTVWSNLECLKKYVLSITWGINNYHSLYKQAILDVFSIIILQHYAFLYQNNND